MKQKIFTSLSLFSLFLFSNCAKNEQIITNFNDKISVTDLINNTEYDKLNKDEEYRDYISDWWENQLGEYDVLNHGTEMLGMMNINESKTEGFKTKAGFAMEAIGSIGSMSVKGLKAMKLESDKKDLFSSFSKEKIDLANKFEKDLKQITNESCISHINKKVKDKDLLLNYKSFKGVINQDEELNDQLEELTDNVDDLFAMGFELRTKLNFNLKVNSKLKYDYLSKIANKILNSPEYEPNLDSNYIMDYFKKMKAIVSEMNTIKTQKFKIPVEDWSPEKRENFEFILNDINVKLQEETKF